MLLFLFSSSRRHTSSYGDWSSDVCSSDLARDRGAESGHVGLEVCAGIVVEAADLAEVEEHVVGQPVDRQQPVDLQIGRASCRERVLMAVVAGLVKNKCVSKDAGQLAL